MALTLANLERLLKNLARRIQRIERILPTLATKEGLRTAVEEAAREEGERTRRHFDMVAESLRDNIKIIAEGHLSLDARLTRLERRR
jgi:hypothetical protein